MCAAFTPCGGDLVGTWNVTSACGQLAPSQCPGVVAMTSLDVSGTVAFGADGTSTSMVMSTINVTVDVPKTCLGPGQTCDSLAQGGGMATDAGDHCVLTQTQSSSSPSMDTYTTSGTTFVVTKQSGTVETWDYCVSGSMLTASKTDMGGNTIFLYATKQ